MLSWTTFISLPTRESLLLRLITPFIYLLCGYLFLQATALAAPYHEATVHSVYLDNTSGQWHQSIDWIFREDDQGNVSISKQLDSAPLILLDYNKMNLVTVITKRLQRGDQTIEIKESVHGPILLSTGFPAPYDQLGSLNVQEGQLNLKTTVADTTFSSTIIRTLLPFSPDEALAAGMLTPDTIQGNTHQEFTLISIIKTDQPMIRQLWKTGEPFWLYDETPTRKSWRTSLTVKP
ncbi:MAG: hypothetical protein KJ950_01040 [Proteobacteria bacterium]|nr:hypothetical protein [Pseudomonadota bacterium]MBU1686242.1 hypothetical protein [Pseudomonadota bacterium]